MAIRPEVLNIVEKNTKDFIAKTVARRLVEAATVLAAPGDPSGLRPSPEKSFNKPQQFVRQESMDKQVNRLDDATKDLKNQNKYVSPELSLLEKTLTKFVDDLSRNDITRLNSSQVQQTAHLVSSVMALVQMLHTVGLKATDIQPLLDGMHNDFSRVFHDSYYGKQADMGKWGRIKEGLKTTLRMGGPGNR